VVMVVAVVAVVAVRAPGASVAPPRPAQPPQGLPAVQESERVRAPAAKPPGVPWRAVAAGRRGAP
jgi:hypothetical protein